MPDTPLSAADIAAYLAEVAEGLGANGPVHVVLVVGGSLLAWHGLRDTTADVDSVRRLDDELRAAAAEVGRRHGLDPSWLNDFSAMFRPANLSESDCDFLAEYPRLRVLGVPLRYVFVMKLYAARSRDHADLQAMWNNCGFATPQEAAALFHEAYPHLENDPFLADYLTEIASEASRPAE